VQINDDGLKIAFFNLHGNVRLTEHCAKRLAKRLKGADVILTAESKGLQLSHCIAKRLRHDFYAVARKTKKLYMADCLITDVKSITTKGMQIFYLSNDDAKLLNGKKVAIVDDVVSTGGSLLALENLVSQAGGTVVSRAFVLAEGDAKERKDITYLAEIPLFN